jgi:hypothetical protein
MRSHDYRRYFSAQIVTRPSKPGGIRENTVTRPPVDEGCHRSPTCASCRDLEACYSCPRPVSACASCPVLQRCPLYHHYNKNQ